MRILFLSDNFPPEVNAPATRLHEHAIRWVRDGHEVTVVTCAPNFPEGKVYPGYRNSWRQIENIDGIRVVRVKTFITANEGVVKRTLDYLSFMVAGFVGGLMERRPDLVVATTPQFFCAVGGWALSAVRRLPFVLELRDLWPESISAVGALREGRVLRFLERLEMFLYRQASRIVTVTKSFRDNLVMRGIHPDKIHVVVNGVDLDRYGPVEREPTLARAWNVESKFVVGYVGTHGMAHALHHVVEAATLLSSREEIVFLFAGGGAERLRIENMVGERRLANVRLVPRQPKTDMPALWSLCDVALIPLRDVPVFATVLPSKLFEAMGMGVPVLLALPEGEATRIVRATGCGLCTTPEDPRALADAVASLADNRKKMTRLRAACLEAAPVYSRDRQARLMLEVLESLAAESTGRRPHDIAH